MPVWFALSLIGLVWGLSWLGEHPAWAVTLGLGICLMAWWTKNVWPKPHLPFPAKPIGSVTPGQIEAQLQASQTLIQALNQLDTSHDFAAQLSEIYQAQTRQTLMITIWGEVGSGQAELASQLDHLGSTEIQLQVSSNFAQIPTADLVLFCLSGDLTQQEHNALETLQAQEQRFLVIWQQPPTAHLGELGQLQAALHQKLGKLVAVADWLILRPGQIEPLNQRLQQILAAEKQHLIWQATFKQAQAWHAQIQTRLNQRRQELAQPIIRRYQWLGAGVAAVNPLPILDLVVTGGLLVQLTWELGKLYHRSFDVTQARPIAETLLRLIVQLGAVEVSTQAVSHWLKGNSLTYLAGSCLQGASVAYVIQVGGCTLVDYWQTVSEQPATTVNMPFYLQASLQKMIRQLPRKAFFAQFQAPVPAETTL